jgi:hypothetical protein
VASRMRHFALLHFAGKGAAKSPNFSKTQRTSISRPKSFQQQSHRIDKYPWIPISAGIWFGTRRLEEKQKRPAFARLPAISSLWAGKIVPSVATLASQAIASSYFGRKNSILATNRGRAQTGNDPGSGLKPGAGLWVSSKDTWECPRSALYGSAPRRNVSRIGDDFRNLLFGKLILRKFVSNN